MAAPVIKGIALLTSTRPICRDVPRPGGGVPKRAIDPRACAALGQKFDLVIIASAASDKVYDRITQVLPAGIRRKFRFYSRTFFDKLSDPAHVDFAEQGLSEGWKQILKANSIFFVTEREVVNDDFSTSFESFHWRKMRHFVNDRRAVLIDSREQFMAAD